MKLSKAMIKTILLVEDNQDHIALLTISLKKTFPTSKIIEAHNGEIALDLLGILDDTSIPPSISPDLILLDINLPKYSGFEVLQNIRFQNRYKDTLILAISTSTSKTDIDLMLELGANDFYIKSHNCLDIGDAVMTSLEKHFYRMRHQLVH